MKPTWIHTLAWLAAVVAAVLLALANPDGLGYSVGGDFVRPQGAMAPR